jgi:hypothetical protein
MPRNDIGILRGRATDLKDVGRNSWHGVAILLAATLLSFSSFHLE